METYLQHLDKLNQLVETQQPTSILSLIHEFSGFILVAGLLLVIVGALAVSAVAPTLGRQGTSGAIEGMLFAGVFFIIGLYGIADMFVYPIVTPVHEQLGITEESYTNIVNAIADMPEDEYNTLVESKKTYKLTEKQQDEYKPVLEILNHKRTSK